MSCSDRILFFDTTGRGLRGERIVCLLAAVVAIAGCASPSSPPAAASHSPPAAAAERRASALKIEEEARRLVRADLAAARAKWREARAVLDQLLEANPSDWDAVYDLGLFWEREARALAQTDLPAALQLAERADQLYSRALELKPVDSGPANTAGVLLDDLADLLGRSDLPAARALWARARARYQWALDTLSGQHGAANNMGNAHASEATAMEPTNAAETQELRRRAAGFYELALRLKPDKANAAMNWANLLADEAGRLSATEWVKATQLWDQADEKYRQSLVFDPQYASAAYSWGTTLEARADATAERDLPAARELWHRAVTQLRRALQIDPAHPGALINLAVARMHEADAIAMTEPSAARELHDSAIGTARIVLQKGDRREDALSLLGRCLSRRAAFAASTDRAAAEADWAEAAEQFRASMALRPTALAAERWAVMLSEQAGIVGTSDGAAGERLWQACREKCALTLELDPHARFAPSIWAEALVHQAEQISATDPTRALILLREADARFAARAAQRPLSAYYEERWAVALDTMAGLVVRQNPAIAFEAWTNAARKYEQVLNRQPLHPTARGNRLNAMRRHAEALQPLDPDGARELLLQAMQFGRDSFRLFGPGRDLVRRLVAVLNTYACEASTPDFYAARAAWSEAREYLSVLPAAELKDGFACQWATSLMNEAYYTAVRDFAAAGPLWEEAETRFQTAARLQPESAYVFAQWARLWILRGDAHWWIKPGDRPIAVPMQMWTAAVEKCDQAMGLDADLALARTNAAMALMRLYGEMPAPERLPYLEKAQAILLKGEESRPGEHAYNLACLAGLRNDAADCVKWLNQAHAAGTLPRRTQVEADPYLLLVKDSPELTAWYAAKLPPRAGSK